MIHYAGRLTLSDLSHLIQTDPAAKALAGARTVSGAPVTVELVDDSGQTVGYGEAVGYELVGRDGTKNTPSRTPGVLVIRARVKSLRAGPDAVTADGPPGSDGPQCDPGPPAFNGTYPDWNRRVKIKGDGPPNPDAG